MPELPEVETICQGLKATLIGKKIKKVRFFRENLREPLPHELTKTLPSQTLIDIKRRAKYLLFYFEHSLLLCHLGMSGSFYIKSANEPLKKHDHVEFVFNENFYLRYNDPRRFGLIITANTPIDENPKLNKLGPEPLSPTFNSDFAFKQTRTKQTAIKSWLMNNHYVVGVGNIYAQESLFLAEIHPNRPAKTLTNSQCQALVNAVKKILKQAIAKGGTTLKDFSHTDGKPGYFKQALKVYGRTGLPCFSCNQRLEKTIIAGRSTCYCPSCQN